MRRGMDQDLEAVIGRAAESAQHDEQSRPTGIVRDLSAAHFVEAGDLVEEPCRLRPAIFREQLHQRTRELVGRDRKLFKRLLDRC